MNDQDPKIAQKQALSQSEAAGYPFSFNALVCPSGTFRVGYSQVSLRDTCEILVFC